MFRGVVLLEMGDGVSSGLLRLSFVSCSSILLEISFMSRRRRRSARVVCLRVRSVWTCASRERTERMGKKIVMSMK